MNENLNDYSKINLTYTTSAGLTGSHSAYTIEGNKLTITMSRFGAGKETKTIELTDEVMGKIIPKLEELNNYYNTEEGKEEEFIFDYGYTIEGTANGADVFVMHNNETAQRIVHEIENIVYENNKDLKDEIENIWNDLLSRDMDFDKSNMDIYKEKERVKEKVRESEYGTLQMQDMLYAKRDELEPEFLDPQLGGLVFKVNDIGDTLEAELSGNILRVRMESRGIKTEKEIELTEDQVKLLYRKGQSYLERSKDGTKDEYEGFPIINDLQNMIIEVDGRQSKPLSFECAYDFCETLESIDSEISFEDFKNRAAEEVPLHEEPIKYEEEVVNEMPKETIDNNKVEENITKPIDKLINKYPGLFDDQGNLKEKGVELIDAILETYASNLIKKDPSIDDNFNIKM